VTQRLGMTVVVAFVLGWAVGYFWLAAPAAAPSADQPPGPHRSTSSPESPCNCARERALAMGQAFESCDLRVYLSGTAEPFPAATAAEREQAQVWLEGLVAECPQLLHDAKRQLLCDEMPCIAFIELSPESWAQEPDFLRTCSGLRMAQPGPSERGNQWLLPLLPSGWLSEDQSERWHRRWRARKLLLPSEP
jgi:hypothetical protein